MAFLLINGIDVPILARNPQGRVSPMMGSTHSRLADHGLATHRGNGMRESWDLLTTPMPMRRALFLASMLSGYGHVWNFDDSVLWPYSDRKGLYSLYAPPANANYSTAHKWGSGSLLLQNATSIYWAAEIKAMPWTVALWYSTGGSWSHYIENSEGEAWLNGQTAPLAGFVIVTSTGTLRLYHDTQTHYFDNLTVFRGAIEDADAYALYTNSLIRPITAPPFFYVQGDLFRWQGEYHCTSVSTISTPFDSSTVDGSDGATIQFSIEVAK